MPTKNMWGDLPTMEDTETPLQIMREQANVLKQATRGLLNASITTTPLTLGQMRHSFYLVAPLLNDYRHLLFSVEHGIDPYPARFSAPRMVKPATCKSHKHFELILTALLQDASTRKAVASLIANSQAVKQAA
ncbi:MAG: hypothetical protein ACKVY0_23910 [Prosthecobacter sp.]|uniref:hypothetical protein n=1 Tax=Prosthecobacter sp. TaxID=1965333 RepID=UPI0038FE6586